MNSDPIPSYVRRVRRYKLRPFAAAPPRVVDSMGVQRDLALELAWALKRTGVEIPVDHCEGCGAPIYWAAWGGLRHALPVDVEPVGPDDEDGRIILAVDKSTRILKAKLLDELGAAPEGRRVYRAHYGSCPASQDASLTSRLARRDRLVAATRSHPAVLEALDAFGIDPDKVIVEVELHDKRATAHTPNEDEHHGNTL